MLGAAHTFLGRINQPCVAGPLRGLYTATLELVTSQAMASTEDHETFYSPLPGNRNGSDDEENEPETPPPPTQYPRALELVRTILREETSEDGFGSLNYDPFTSDASLSEARKYTPAKKRILLGYSGRTFWRWSITACLGVVTGCVAVA